MVDINWVLHAISIHAQITNALYKYKNNQIIHVKCVFYAQNYSTDKIKCHLCTQCANLVLEMATNGSLSIVTANDKKLKATTKIIPINKIYQKIMKWPHKPP